MLDDKDRYRLRRFEELQGDPIPVSLVNQALPADNVATLLPRERSLHATLCELREKESDIAAGRA
jgi:hypothetical protein